MRFRSKFCLNMTKNIRVHVIRIVIISLGWIFVLAGVYLYFNWINIFTRMRGKEMYLRPESPSFDGWKNIPIPLNLDIYMFNWTNPQDFDRNSNKKPHFVELGPYRFVEIPDKVDIEWHTKNHSVSFRKKATFYFDHKNSKGTLKDKITSVNTVAHSIALRFKDDSNFQKMLVARTLKMHHAGVSITKTADEWLFTGYSDPFLTLGTLLSKFSKDIKIPYDRVGYLYTRNNSATYEGYYNMLTGADNISNLGQIHSWNHMEHNGVYEGECGQVKGSMGEFYPPNLTPSDTLWLYVTKLCRAIPLDYMESTKIHDVNGYKYSAGERAIDNGTLFPSNKCFCVGGKCERSGVFSVAPCAFNSSLYTSFPHFYKADPYYLESIEGLKPEKEKHEFFVTVEPNTGVPLEVGGGFQANYLMEPIKNQWPFDRIPRAFIPLMWAEERAQLPAELTAEVGLVPVTILIGYIFTGILLALGIILLCWYPAKFLTPNYLCSKQQKVQLIKQIAFNTDKKPISLPRKSSSDLENTDLLQQKKNVISRD
uniref:Scavenger receptor class B n=1 Tax=Glossina brevipalpis TaxID=37001 RepID=A0A1A9WDN4_9MUSC